MKTLKEQLQEKFRTDLEKEESSMPKLKSEVEKAEAELNWLTMCASVLKNGNDNIDTINKSRVEEVAILKKVVSAFKEPKDAIQDVGEIFKKMTDDTNILITILERHQNPALGEPLLTSLSESIKSFKSAKDTWDELLGETETVLSFFEEANGIPKIIDNQKTNIKNNFKKLADVDAQLGAARTAADTAKRIQKANEEKIIQLKARLKDV
jgi:nitrogenase molybdenum-iron protein alpha/beta subunit